MTRPAVLPTEPLPGSRVIDEHGQRWDHRPAGWRPVTAAGVTQVGEPATWEQLHVAGRVRVLVAFRAEM